MINFFLLKIISIDILLLIKKAKFIVYSVNVVNFNLLFIYFFVIYRILLLLIMFNLKNILIFVFFVELTFFTVICLLITSGLAWKLDFQYSLGYSLLILLIAAAESAISLSILIFYHTEIRNLDFENIVELRL
jgi:NADH:ubiquinone oxidoreductase subunit K